MEIGAAHWVYLAGMAVIIGVMAARKNVVIPSIIGTLLTVWVFTGDLVAGLQSVFNSGLTAAASLFSIFLIIALMTALLGSLRAMGADRRMVEPFRPVMRNGPASFWVIALVTWILGLFFWPTPTASLIGAVLIPVALRAGLSPIGAAVSIAIAGQGMALSSDYVIQVAPGLSATAAGVDTAAVADKGLVLSLVTGGVALVLAHFMLRDHMALPGLENLWSWERGGAAPLPGGGRRRRLLSRATPGGRAGAPEPAAATAPRGGDSEDARARLAEPAGQAVASAAPGKAGLIEADPALATQVETDVETAAKVEGAAGADAVAGTATGSGGAGNGQQPGRVDGGGGDPPGPAATEATERLAKVFALVVPLAFAALVVYMLLSKFTDLVPELVGGATAALVGGTTGVLLLAATIAHDRAGSLETCAAHIIDGLVFSMKAMGVVIPIAGFFFLGNAEFAGQILGLEEGATAPSFLFDLVIRAQELIPENPLIVSFGLLLIGMLTGLDGSGFSGLPLTGSLAGSLGAASSVDPSLLAAIGQMGAIWTGGGVLVAWSSLVAVAGIARVSVLDVVRVTFLPVIAGLIMAVVVGVILY